MTEQQACTLCGAGGHTAAQCNWNKADDAPLYSEGICQDGAAILRDGVPVPVAEIIEMLNSTAQSQPSPAPELERPEVAGWRDRILKDLPDSDPRYWPDALLVQYMTAEIADLRTTPVAQAGQVPSDARTKAMQLRVFLGKAGFTEQALIAEELMDMLAAAQAQGGSTNE